MSLWTAARRLLLLAALFLLIPAHALAQRIDPELAGVFSGLAVDGKVNVIVTFTGNRGVGASELDVLRAVGITGGATFERLPMVATRATWDQVQALSQNAAVRSVFWDQPLVMDNFDATHLTGARRVRGDETFRQKNNRSGSARYVTGRGVTVLVNDSGIDGAHPDLKFNENLIQNAWRPVGREDFEGTGFQPPNWVENVINTDIGSGHGTHVAGTVGGTGAASNYRHTGVAPGANLIGYGSGAVLFIMDALGGFDYAIAKQDRYNIRVVTNSWGSQSRPFDPDNPINVATRLTEQAGIVVLFSAGNAGPGPNTHNRYAKAPWVISVAAGEKSGKLAGFSSRGLSGGPKKAVSSTGDTITYLDEPTITAPGVAIVSAKASTGALGTVVDAYHVSMSGTSMAAPHAAGIVALMLEANPFLKPAEVKQILKETATKMPDALPGQAYRSFETGAGYINAYAAVQKSFDLATPFGKTLQVDGAIGSQTIAPAAPARTINWNPAALPGTYKRSFTVAPNTGRIEVAINFKGVEVPAYGNLGNPILLDVRDPNGVRYYAFDTYFAIYGTIKLIVAVNNPTPGTWTVEPKSLTPLGNDIGPIATAPDTVNETITAFNFATPTISDLPQDLTAQRATQFALVNGFLGLCGAGTFCPSSNVTRADLARGFTQFGAVRQHLPHNGGSTFADVSATDKPFVEAVAARGAALRDREAKYSGIIEGNGTSFNPTGSVSRAEFAKALVRAVGGDAAALAHGTTKDVTVLLDGKSYLVADQADIPAGLRGFVQVAINSNMLNVFWTIEQGPYDATPVLKPYFRPTQAMTRADAAVAISRYYPQYFK